MAGDDVGDLMSQRSMPEVAVIKVVSHTKLWHWDSMTTMISRLNILLIVICLIGGWVIAAATAHAGSTWELYWKWYGDAPGQFAYGTVNGATFTSADITCTVNGTAIPRPGNQATMHCTAATWRSVTNGIIQTRDATKFVYYGTGTGSPASTRDMGNGTIGNAFISYTTLQPAY